MTPWIVSIIVTVIAGVLLWRQRQSHADSIIEMDAAKRRALEHALNEHEEAMQELQKRTSRQHREDKKALERAHFKLAKDLFSSLDDLERARHIAEDQNLPNVSKGLSMVSKGFEQALSRHGIDAIRPHQDDAFDPEVHEAISVTDSDKTVAHDAPSQTIDDTLRTGWRHVDVVLRPAMVKIAKHRVDAPPEVAVQDSPDEDVAFDFDQEDAQEEEESHHVQQAASSRQNAKP